MNDRQSRDEWTEQEEWSAAVSEEEPMSHPSQRRSEREENLSEKSAAQLEDEIEAIRAEMDETLRRLERSFSPGELLDRAIHQWGGEPKEFARNFGSAVRDNPLPVTLAGVSLAWLIASTNSSPESREGLDSGSEKLREMSHKVGDRFHRMSDRMHAGAASASESMHETKASAGEKAEDLRERTQELGEDARRRSRQVKEELFRVKDEHPVVLAGVGLALGALLGGALPPTRTEDRFMGEARDTAMERARVKGREQAQATEDVLRSAAQSAQEEAERRLH